MKHYGDITKINGAEAPIVDVICGGSPCQDLSVAGKRAGLDGERSGLFMEQVRIVKEQRNECIRQLQLRGADVDLRYVKPRYMVWENVPGAFSSNKGEDFRCVLEEICRIADKTATVPLPEKGKWSNSGAIVGDGWSVAWRVHDSQFWGVPQRRRRIALVADFGGQSAPEILFEREGVSGDIEQSNKEGEETTATAGNGIKAASNVFGDDIMPTLVSRLETPVGNTQDGFNVVSFQERGGKPGGGKGILIQDEKTASLRTQQNQSVCYGLEPGAAQRIGGESRYPEEISPTLRSNMGDNQVGVACYGMDNERRRGPEEHEDQSPTITSRAGTGGNNVPVVIEGNGSRPSHNGDGFKESEVSYTLNSTEVHGVCHEEPVLLANNQNMAEVSQTGIVNTLPAAMGMGGGYVPMITDTYQKTTGALCASGYDKLGTQEAMNDMYVVSHGGFMVDADNSGVAHTLQATDYKDAQVVAYGVDSYNQTAQKEKAETLRTNGGGDNSPKVGIVYGVDCYNQSQTEETCKALTNKATDSDPIPCVYGVVNEGGQDG